MRSEGKGKPAGQISPLGLSRSPTHSPEFYHRKLTLSAISKLRGALLAWYRRRRRDLPWRSTRDPYAIWLSEVMLQQTRAAAVIPYYERFLARFPTVESLAAAPEQDVLALWSGLGYYFRARNLHRAARQIVERGTFPTTYDEIRALPGAGPYTAAAVASIAFDLPHAVLDGNVVRVLSRLSAEPGLVSRSETRARLDALAACLLPRSAPGAFNQAVMELGATVCLPRRPLCAQCPLASHCEAHRRGLESQFPVRPAAPKILETELRLLIVTRSTRVLLTQRPAESARLGGMWELPEGSQLPDAVLVEPLGTFRHAIVSMSYHYEVWTAKLRRPPQGFMWCGAEELSRVPLTTAARKALCLAGFVSAVPHK
jgi:A/G-specific adenine glycosylase